MLNEQLKGMNQLRQSVDDLIEQSQKEHWTLLKTIESTFPFLIEALPIQLDNLFVYTYSEKLKMQLFIHDRNEESSNIIPHSIIEDKLSKSEQNTISADNYHFISVKLDVSGEYFGYTALSYHKEITDNDIKLSIAILKIFNDILDNYLQNIKITKTKTFLLDQLGLALQEKILENSLEKVVNILKQKINFKNFILYFWDPYKGKESLKYRIYVDGALKYYSLKYEDNDVHNEICSEGHHLIIGKKPNYLLDLLKISSYKIFDLNQRIYNESQAILVLDIEDEDLNLFNSDLLERFCQLLLLRLLDFNKEFNLLSQYFRKEDVHSIIESPDYEKTILNPRDKEIAILFSDISSFTMISEQILKSPGEIGDFINEWIKEVCQIIWKNSGVVDKFVGDCAIALFGPPMFTMTQKDACTNAIQTAIDIRDYTQSLNNHPRWKAIIESGLLESIGVASGINFGSTLVGNIGKNLDYTGFSSTMNNTARLQGLAKRDEILVMDNVKKQITDEFQFSEALSANVKNVKEAIEYFKII